MPLSPHHPLPVLRFPLLPLPQFSQEEAFRTGLGPEKALP